MDYEKMLDRAIEKIPKVSDASERFKVPEISAFLMGTRTLINNFTEITNAVRREPEHLQKFLFKELATKGELSGPKLILQGKFTKDAISRKIELYLKEYVYCQDCGKPDTKIMKEDRFLFLKCEACGSKHVVKRL
ncbi:MAG: translation initiation factor IF-2 subunit beta [Candidatus Aenigmarchaeota archaeon]|nr:translation initiation factor IF-2 subunit beta [Candidatus Aenigmarchaeota archaeon]